MSFFERIRHPYVLMTLAALFWSGNMVVARAVREDVPPVALAYWRWVVTLALTLPFAWPHLRVQWPAVRANRRVLVVLGILGIGLYNTLAYVGVQHTTATTALLLNAFIPIAIIAISWAFLRKTLSRVEALGVAISFGGVIGIVSHGDIGILIGLDFNMGDLWMVAAVLSWAVYTVCLQQWRPAELHPMLLLAVLTVVGLALLTPVYVWEISTGKTISLTTAAFAYQGVFPAFVGYVFYAHAVKEIGGSKAGLFLYLTPVFGTFLSVAFLGELPRAYHYIGIAMIFSGIYLTTAGVGMAKPPLSPKWSRDERVAGMDQMKEVIARVFPVSLALAPIGLLFGRFGRTGELGSPGCVPFEHDRIYRKWPVRFPRVFSARYSHRWLGRRVPGHSEYEPEIHSDVVLRFPAIAGAEALQGDLSHCLGRTNPMRRNEGGQYKVAGGDQARNIFILGCFHHRWLLLIGFPAKLDQSDIDGTYISGECDFIRLKRHQYHCLCRGHPAPTKNPVHRSSVRLYRSRWIN